MTAKRYFLARDQSCHWYLVDAGRRDEWIAWSNLPEDDERAWDPPACARRINGGPSYVVFSDPAVGPGGIVDD